MLGGSKRRGGWGETLRSKRKKEKRVINKK